MYKNNIFQNTDKIIKIVFIINMYFSRVLTIYTTSILSKLDDRNIVDCEYSAFRKALNIILFDKKLNVFLNEIEVILLRKISSLFIVFETQSNGKYTVKYIFL